MGNKWVIRDTKRNRYIPPDETGPWSKHRNYAWVFKDLDEAREVAHGYPPHIKIFRLVPSDDLSLLIRAAKKVIRTDYLCYECGEQATGFTKVCTWCDKHGRAQDKTCGRKVFMEYDWAPLVRALAKMRKR